MNARNVQVEHLEDMKVILMIGALIKRERKQMKKNELEETRGFCTIEVFRDSKTRGLLFPELMR